MNALSTANIWAIIPAAGIGSRMQAEIPKQYLTLLNKTILETSIEKLLEVPEISGVVVAIHPNDKHWPKLEISQHPKVFSCEGGTERSDSVTKGIEFLIEHLSKQQENTLSTWVLVHDAARPCVSISKIQELIAYTLDNTQEIDGAILASPTSDTVKRVDPNNKIKATENRSELWLAHTPQFFEIKSLHKALLDASSKSIHITDEASAMEAAGYSVATVRDRRDNIKVTLPEDLAWAELIIRNQNS